MTPDRIEQIQNETAYPDSQSVKSALFTVWSETERHITSLTSGVITGLETQVEQQQIKIKQLENLVKSRDIKGRNINGVLIPGKPLRQL